jgi:hypothetical protein
MALEIQQAADVERSLSQADRTWHAILLAAQPFEPTKLGRGSS